jgi:guanyl-specific ribonuclease Sa
MRGYRLWLLLAVAFSIALGQGCTRSEQTQLSTADKQTMTEVSRQAEIHFRSDQINRSNLPLEQKQRLLQQLRSGAGK